MQIDKPNPNLKQYSQSEPRVSPALVMEGLRTGQAGVALLMEWLKADRTAMSLLQTYLATRKPGVECPQEHKNAPFSSLGLNIRDNYG